jgi:hypothetical protein
MRSPICRSAPTLTLLSKCVETFGEFFLMMPVASAIGQLKWLQALRVKPVYEFRAMDAASRGPWGSFVLIIRRKGGYVLCSIGIFGHWLDFKDILSFFFVLPLLLTLYRLIASFGALITIITLGIGTCVQQALVYDTIYVSTSDAFVSTAKYMNGTGTAQLSGTQGSTNGVDAEVQAAAYIGLFSPVLANFTVSAQCNTGNCTWDPYRTLAICNTCADLTSSLNRIKVQLEIDNDPKNVYHTDYYTLPNGVVLNGLQQVTAKAPLFASVLNITTTANPSLSDGEVGTTFSSIAFANNASALLSVFAIGLSPGKVPPEPDSDSTPASMTGDGFGSPVAFECLLQFCVQEMRAEFRNGTLNETVLSTWTNNTQVSPGLINVLNADTVLQPPDSGDIFIATVEAVDGTSKWLNYLLTGNATIFTNSDVINLESVGTTQSALEPFVIAMNNSATGFPDMMDNVARSISRNLRTITYQPPPVSGLAFSPTTRATVVWAWLTLPFFLLVAGLVFLVVVIVETERKGLVPWTNNVLAALFHGIDKRSSDHQARETEYVMEEEARALLVEFRPHEDGGRLVAAKL